MKIIVSHDVDHLYWSEHLFKDLFIPKYVVKNLLFGMKGQLSSSMLAKRFSALLKNRMHNLDELNAFNKDQDISATYFVGVNNGLSLSYNQKEAKNIIEKLKGFGADLGIHGIAFDQYEDIAKEHDDFKSLSGDSSFGIRMHYLRNNHQTLGHLAACGYAFDSTIPRLGNPYKVDGMWEFPVSLMDVNMVKPNYRDAKNAIENSITIIESALAAQQQFFTLIFHDVYFNQVFHAYMDWYIGIIEYFKSRQFEFINFTTAIKELANSNEYS